MLPLFWFLLVVVAICIGLLMPVLWNKQIDNTFRDPRSANSPKADLTVAVRSGALRGAFVVLSGKPKE
jgi:hypothetical protein